MNQEKKISSPAEGVLSHDGRVVCPWHGACFNVCTGDIEDAPGLDSLWSFAASERDGKIFVKANEKEVKSKVGRVVPKSRTVKEHTKEKVVIVGGGSGGIHTIESLRMVSGPGAHLGIPLPLPSIRLRPWLVMWGIAHARTGTKVTSCSSRRRTTRQSTGRRCPRGS
jgi:hypothetical protein